MGRCLSPRQRIYRPRSHWQKICLLSVSRGLLTQPCTKWAQGPLILEGGLLLPIPGKSAESA